MSWVVCRWRGWCAVVGVVGGVPLSVSWVVWRWGLDRARLFGRTHAPARTAGAACMQDGGWYIQEHWQRRFGLGCVVCAWWGGVCVCVYLRALAIQRAPWFPRTRTRTRTRPGPDPNPNSNPNPSPNAPKHQRTAYTHTYTARPPAIRTQTQHIHSHMHTHQWAPHRLQISPLPRRVSTPSRRHGPFQPHL